MILFQRFKNNKIFIIKKKIFIYWYVLFTDIHFYIIFISKESIINLSIIIFYI